MDGSLNLSGRLGRVWQVARSPVGALSLLSILVFSVGANGTSCNAVPNPGGGTPVIVESDHVLGSADASVTVVEYSSLTCGWCARFAQDQFPAIEERYIDTGQVRWVVRHLISMSNEDRVRAASACECAGDQGSYFDCRELVFENQTDLSEATLKQYATTLGLDQDVFDACLDGGTKEDRVRQDVDSGIALGASSTPTFFVGSEMVRGYQTADAFGAILDRHLGG